MSEVERKSGYLNSSVGLEDMDYLVDVSDNRYVNIFM